MSQVNLAATIGSILVIGSVVVMALGLWVQVRHVTKASREAMIARDLRGASAKIGATSLVAAIFLAVGTLSLSGNLVVLAPGGTVDTRFLLCAVVGAACYGVMGICGLLAAVFYAQHSTRATPEKDSSHRIEEG
jgi:hypothetical protein